MFGINGYEAIILIVIATLLLGPSRIPEYLQKLREFILQIRTVAGSAQNQLNDQLGDSVDIKRLDPRQYDPRRVIRDAMQEELPDSTKIMSASSETHLQLTEPDIFTKTSLSAASQLNEAPPKNPQEAIEQEERLKVHLAETSHEAATQTAVPQSSDTSTNSYIISENIEKHFMPTPFDPEST